MKLGMSEKVTQGNISAVSKRIELKICPESFMVVRIMALFALVDTFNISLNFINKLLQNSVFWDLYLYSSLNQDSIEAKS
jgi:hypothetical protein